jgi:hypothetical protein
MRDIERISDPEEAKLLLKKRKGKTFDVLMISDHDDYCKKMLIQAEKWAARFPNRDNILYVISASDFPELWGTFSVTVAPALMRVVNGRVSIITEYPSIYNHFNEN